MEWSIEAIITAIAGTILGAMTFIQITPIKLNPWSRIAKMIGRAINAELIEKVNDLHNQVDALSSKIELVEEGSKQRNASNVRNRIINFGDSLLHGKNYSKEHFNQIMIDIKSYETYCREHKDFENGITVQTTEYIKNKYAYNLEHNSFL